jgi:2-amino-4-hydroxy-6-hydroxymethyldihydropteridine diphosphokinase
LKKDKKLVIFSLGSNLGDRRNYLAQGLNSLIRELGREVNVSPIYETPPLGFDAETTFYNCAASIRTNKSPLEILRIIQSIENENKRKRTEDSSTYESRTLDIDITYYSDKLFENEELVIPHANRLERKFVLQPICDIHPEFRDPIVQRTIKELLNAISDVSELKKIGVL